MRYETDKQAFQAALDMYEGGACNPRGVGRAVVELIDYSCAQRNGSDIREHPTAAAVRLALAQLSYLVGHGIGDYPQFESDLEVCKRGVK